MLLLVLQPLAQCLASNTQENAGAKFTMPKLGVVYVVPFKIPISSTQFIQYTSSAIFVKCIRLSLAISAPVAIDVSVPHAVNV